ncbi:putative reverse transcriptase domain-containing protein [Tanacetum coccineum]|uniref:Reverse transcriptase domain-containing protein n=1 Tax=Tanacetum coccineum TaxID=301880 RepID=A0ABQ4XXY6_9ASTR
MDGSNITMEEYIKVKEEKARRRGKVFNWETTTYGKIWYDEDVYDLRSVETEFPAIVINDTLMSEPTVSSLNNGIDFRISFNKSDDEDYMPTVSYFDDLDYFKDFEKEFPAIVYNDALTSKLDFLTEPTISPQHINEFNLKDETSLSECDEEEQNVLNFNDLFPFNVIYPNDLKLDKDNDDDNVDIEHSSRDLSVKPLPDVINTDVGAYAHGSNNHLETNQYAVSSRRYGVIRACTHQRPQRIKLNTRIQKTILRVLEMWEMKYNFLDKISSVVLTPRNPQYAVSNPWIRQNRKYEWGKEQEEAFQTLKDNLCNALILSLSDEPEDFVFYCDGLNQGFGCVSCKEPRTWKSLLVREREMSLTEIRYHPRKGLVKILAAPGKASKVENATAEMLRGLDQQIERKEDGDDRLTKSAYFLAIREDYKMKKLARLYIDEIVAGHGVPGSVILNRDGRFTSSVLANITESLKDAIGYEYGLSSSDGWIK